MFKAATKCGGTLLTTTNLSRRLVMNANLMRPALIMPTLNSTSMFVYPSAGFAKKTDKPIAPKKEKEEKKVAATTTKKAKKEATPVVEEKPVTPKKASSKKASKKEETGGPIVHRLYTLKFNSPILPFAKFPLT